MATAPGGRPASAIAETVQVGRQHDGLGDGGGRSAGPPTQLGREGRTEEGDVGQAASELLGDDRHLDRRRPRGAVVGGDAQLTPSGGGDRGVELGDPFGIVELTHRARAESVDDLGGRVAQRVLFG